MRVSSTSPLVFVCGLLVSLALVSLCAITTAAKSSFAVKPQPAWIKPAEVDPKQAAGNAASVVLLDDQETRISSGSVERFYRQVERVDTAAGLEGVSQLRFYFEPSYQKLVIHYIKIIRGNQTIDSLKPSEVKIVQTEGELNEQLYNGTKAAVVFLNDVRVGDVVDYAFTVSGDNPVFGGWFSERFYLANRDPIQAFRVRILLPSDRVLHIRGQGTEMQPKINSLGGETEYLWEASNVPAVDLEDSTPTWFQEVPMVMVSELRDWQAVVQWALPLYRVVEPPAEARTKSDTWIGQVERPEQRMVAALRFVQQEIRYLGIELGSYSHQPNPPSRILTRRFGDCKDKSLLLATILNYMGIDSAIALVSTRTRRSLDAWQPSPHAFDHVIVRARIDGKTYWLDPTIDSQRGSFDKYYDPPYERALVLRADTRELEAIPSSLSESATTAVKEHYIVRDSAGPVALVVTTTYSAADADDMRASLSTSSRAEMGKYFLNYYAASNPSIKPDGLPQIEDNEEVNMIVIKEKYTIDSFWKDQNHYFGGYLIYTQLLKPDILKRSKPLSVPHPTFATQSIEIDLPAPYELAPHAEVIANDAFRFDYSYQSTGRGLRLDYSLKTLRDSVPPEDVAQHLEQIDRIRNNTGLLIPRGSVGIVHATGGPGSNRFQVFVLISTAVVIFIAFVVVKLRRKREIADRSFTLKPLPGVAPETAVRCKYPSDIDTFTQRFKCGCGSYPFKPDALLNQETLLYDGERLSTLKLKCDACGRSNDLYFVQPKSQDD